MIALDCYLAQGKASTKFKLEMLYQLRKILIKCLLAVGNQVRFIIHTYLVSGGAWFKTYAYNFNNSKIIFTEAMV
jgi:hypothetical protein